MRTVAQNSAKKLLGGFSQQQARLATVAEAFTANRIPVYVGALGIFSLWFSTQ
jgi:hypothetical protein